MNTYNKLRKDKTNFAVYQTMKQAANHPYVNKLLDTVDAVWLNPHRKGYDMDYMSIEHRLNQFFTSSWSGRVRQLEEKFGEERAREIEQRLKKVFSCKGLVYNRKNQYQCHHPSCPLCYHRKLYKVIKDLKPYLSKERVIQVLSLTHLSDRDTVGFVYDGLETRAKRLIREVSPFTEQWIRIPHIAYSEEMECFILTCLIIIIPVNRKRQSDLKPIYKKYEEKIGLQGRAKLDALMDSMPELLKKFLYYDPLVLRHGGSWAMEEWDRKTPWFRYRAKHAHG